MALKRLRGISPLVTRKLFNVTVAPVVDYASSIWTHARTASAERVVKRVQRVGGQAVIGCFQTVGTAVAEAEANLPTIGERHSRKALRMWVDLHSIPSAHPLAQIIRRRACKRYTSPLQKIAEYACGAPTDELEATQPYISAPWDARLDIAHSVDDGEHAVGCAQGIEGIRVATSASARPRTCSPTIAPFWSRCGMAPEGPDNVISGIIEHVRRLNESHNRVVFTWAPVSPIFELGQKAKQLAQRSADEGRVVRDRPRLTRSMVHRTQERLRRVTEQVPATVGEPVRRIDTAWPGSHT